MLNNLFLFFPRCIFRFPSTNIKIIFQSLLDEGTPPRQPLPELLPQKPLPPLRINIPDNDVHFPSPIPSPTGTIRFVKLISYAIEMCFTENIMRVC